MTTFKPLFDGFIPNATTVLYTVPDHTRTVITKATITSNGGSGVTLNVWKVARQQTASTLYLVVSSAAIPGAGGRGVDLDELEGLLMMTGETLVASAGASNALVAHFAGLEITD